jgi:tRNA(Arg) A34 adenosine deaminase TadA
VETLIFFFMDNERSFLQRAVKIAGKEIENGAGPFGAVITKNGKVIAEANNRVVQQNDPTAHAEILAIRKASEILKSFNLGECTLYTSCEPCPMCLGAIYWAGIKKVVYSSDRNEAAAAGFNDRFIYDEILLAPSERKISFVHIDENESKKVFTKWIQSENKIPY